MKHSKALHWLTALALLLGQWGMLVHAGEHEFDGAEDALCVVCIQGHNLQDLQLSDTPITVFEAARLNPAEPAKVQTLAAASKRSTIRAPPYTVHS
ncbi:MAG: hypothetical protein ACPHER_06790 [Nevskiales bacterium]